MAWAATNWLRVMPYSARAGIVEYDKWIASRYDFAVTGEQFFDDPALQMLHRLAIGLHSYDTRRQGGALERRKSRQVPKSRT